MLFNIIVTEVCCPISKHSRLISSLSSTNKHIFAIYQLTDFGVCDNSISYTNTTYAIMLSPDEISQTKLVFR